jgi:hypothetical protein
MRVEKLNSLVHRAIIEAFSLGYKSSEIRTVFENAIRQIEKESKR